MTAEMTGDMETVMAAEILRKIDIFITAPS